MLSDGRLYRGMEAHLSDRQTAGSALLDVRQVASRLGVTTRFVRRLVDERRIPFCKIGKFVRFDPDDLEAWIAERRVDSVA